MKLDNLERFTRPKYQSHIVHVDDVWNFQDQGLERRYICNVVEDLLWEFALTSWTLEPERLKQALVEKRVEALFGA